MNPRRELLILGNVYVTLFLIMVTTLFLSIIHVLPTSIILSFAAMVWCFYMVSQYLKDLHEYDEVHPQ